MALRPVKIVWRRFKDRWGQARPDLWKITLDPRMDDRTLMDIACHETIHILAPYLDEEVVNDLGIHIADVLARIGFVRAHADD